MRPRSSWTRFVPTPYETRAACTTEPSSPHVVHDPHEPVVEDGERYAEHGVERGNSGPCQPFGLGRTAGGHFSSAYLLASGPVWCAYLLPFLAAYGTSAGEDSSSNVKEQMRMPA